MKKEEAYKLAYKTTQDIIKRLGNNLFILKSIGVTALITMGMFALTNLYVEQNIAIGIIFSSASLVLSIILLYIHLNLIASERNFREYCNYITREYKNMDGKQMLLLDIKILKDNDKYTYHTRTNTLKKIGNHIIWEMFIVFNFSILISSFFL